MHETIRKRVYILEHVYAIKKDGKQFWFKSANILSLLEWAVVRDAGVGPYIYGKMFQFIS